MNAAQRTLQSIGTQLKDLPSTAKMLIFALMVILTLSLFLVAQFAGRPSMVPLPLDLDADKRTAVLSYLATSDTLVIWFVEPSGGRRRATESRRSTPAASPPGSGARTPKFSPIPSRDTAR